MRSRLISQIALIRRLSFGCFLLLCAAPLFADYPLIHHLDESDVLYRQIQQDIERFNARGSNSPPELSLYRYEVKPDQDLLTISARLTLPYSTLATLNRLDSRVIPARMHMILVPNIPGLFVPTNPSSALERELAAHRPKPAAGAPSEKVRVVENGVKSSFLFVPGADFSPDERLSFFAALFRFPVAHGIITSYFGMRTDPFTGLFSFHGGIDIEAPVGTDVMAARDGTVIMTSHDHEYGNFIVLKHDGGYETLYAHLSAILVRLNQKVSSGMIIGKVGSTGMSTGPHLHFEIRYHGKAENPMKFLSTNQ